MGVVKFWSERTAIKLLIYFKKILILRFVCAIELPTAST